MSFDVNASRNLSNVQASAKSCPGGGGNTGYFQRGNEEEQAQLGFAKDYPDDSFEKQEILDEIQNQSFLTIFKNLFLDFIEMIKNLFKKQEASENKEDKK